MPQAAITAAISFPLAMLVLLVLMAFAQLPDWGVFRRWLRRPNGPVRLRQPGKR